MTIATTSNKAIFLGDGSTTVFSYPFIIPSAAYASLQYTDADGNITPLTDSQYTISGVNDPNGGTITYPLSGSPIAADTSLTLLRTVPYKQLTDLKNQSGYYPEVVEGALDYSEMEVQQLHEVTGRSLQFPAVDVNPDPTLPSATIRANKYAGYDANGNPTVYDPAEGLVTSAANVNFLQAGAGAVSRTVQSKERDIVSSRDFGALGYGDDTAAIQLALDSITNGGEVWNPAGTYIASTLSMSYSTRFSGAGFGATTMKLKDAATAATTFLTTNRKDNIEITGICFDGNAANQTYSGDNGQIGVLVRNSSNVSITGCRFKEWGKDAVELYSDDVAADPVQNVLIAGNFFENPRRAGVTIISGSRISITGNQFRGLCSYTPVTNAGITWEPDAATDTLADLLISGNTFSTMLAGCRLTDASAVSPSISNIIVSDNTFTSISGEAGMVAYRLLNAGITITGNRFKSCGNTGASANNYRNGGGVYFSDTNYAMITDNWFDSCVCNGYGTVYADGQNDRCQIKNNTFLHDGQNGIHINRNSATTRGDGTFKQITGNILLHGGQGTANTFYGILVTSTGGAGGGIGDVITGNTVLTSTSSGYGTGIAVNGDDGTSICLDNQIRGNGVDYSFSAALGQFDYTAPATACTGALTNSVIWKATKSGRVVTLTIPAVIGTTTNVVTIEMGATLPAAFRPLVTQYFAGLSVVVNNAAVATPGMIGVNTSGQIIAYRDGTAALGWGTAANTGIIDTSISWVV